MWGLVLLTLSRITKQRSSLGGKVPKKRKTLEFHSFKFYVLHFSRIITIYGRNLRNKKSSEPLLS